MALSMAEKMSGDKDVIMYFDITGIEVLLKDAPDLSFAQFSYSNVFIIFPFATLIAYYFVKKIKYPINLAKSNS